MAKKLKRAFTIVELVIVIAVIAILAAVLIPTFTTLIDRANQSADTQMVKNLNQILSSSQILEGKPASTMSEALRQAEEGGYSVDKLTPTSKGDILWEQGSNRFVLVEEGKIVYGDPSTTAEIGTSYWKITNDKDEAESGVYSYYLGEKFPQDVSELSVKSGIDVGNNVTINISFQTQEERTVLFNTKGAELKINALNATVYHYGDSANVEIIAVAKESYHFYGTVGNITVNNGRVVAEVGSKASLVLAVPTGDSLVKVDVLMGANVPAVKKSGNVVVNVADIEATKVTDLTDEEEELIALFAAGGGTAESPFVIKTEAQLRAISVLSGLMYSTPYYFQLGNDITLKRSSDSDYITNNFNGVFDGNGYSITVDIAENASVKGKLMGYGTYWFFADPTGDVTFQDLTIYHASGMNVAICEAWDDSGKNVVDNTILFKNVDMGSEKIKGETLTMFRNASGYVVYVRCGELIFDGCDNYYNLESDDPELYSGVYVGAYSVSPTKLVKFNNCNNYGNIKGARIGIFFGNFQLGNVYEGYKIELSNCTNEGTISYYISGAVLGQNLPAGKTLYYGNDVNNGVYTTTDDLLKGYTENGQVVSLVDRDMKLYAQGNSLSVESSKRNDVNYKLMYSAYAQWEKNGASGSQIVTLYFDLPVTEGSVSVSEYYANVKFMDKEAYVAKYQGNNAEWGGNVSWVESDVLEGVKYYFDQENLVYVFDFSASSNIITYSLEANATVALCAYDLNDKLIAITGKTAK